MTPTTPPSPASPAKATLDESIYRHPVMVTEAPHGVMATQLRWLADDNLTTVAYVPSPDRRRQGGVAAEAMRALGKRTDVSGKPRHATTEVELVSIWLTAHRTRYLIPLACQRTPAADLLDLVEMTALSPAALLFAVDHGFADSTLAALDPVAPIRVPWPDVPEPDPPLCGDQILQDPRAPDSGDTVLPNVEYWTFYATAKRQLSPQHFAPVHDLYCETLHRLTAWLSDVTARGADLTVDLAHDSLKTLIEEQTTLDRVTVVTRAAQAAYHRAGWFLDIDERELRNGLIRFPPSMTTPDLYTRLRAYREPTRAATVALYLAGATPDAISKTTIDDLAQWHHRPGRAVAGTYIPEEAAPYLRAALLSRANEGPLPSAPAFPGHSRRVRLDLRQAAADLGLNIGDANLNATSRIGDRRVPTNVVRLERLT